MNQEKANSANIQTIDRILILSLFIRTPLSPWGKESRAAHVP